MNQVGDQLDVIGRAIMGMTIGCARCHDHKFDPIPISDYYALAGILRSTKVLNGYTSRRRNNQVADPSLYLKLASLSGNEQRVEDDVVKAPNGRWQRWREA